MDNKSLVFSMNEWTGSFDFELYMVVIACVIFYRAYKWACTIVASNHYGYEIRES